jgi:TatD DNase family protein
MPKAFDSHVHLDTGDGDLVVAEILALQTVDRMALQSVGEADWDLVLRLADALPTVAPGLGIHPWSAPALRGDDTAWLDRLRTLLLLHPAAFVGEIGLDKVATFAETGVVEFSKQQSVFAAQFQLAAELRRPVSVHCVHAHGHLIELLRTSKAAALPPSIALHSFSGKPAVVHEYLRAAGSKTLVFFGFSAVICMRAEERSRAAIACVPDDRILVETDVGETKRVDELMRSIVDVVSQVKQWTREQTALLTRQNAIRWISPPKNDENKEA